MDPLSSGGEFWLRAPNEAWVVLKEAYLTEGTTYDWKYVMHGTEQFPLVQFCGLPHFPHRVEDGEAFGQLTTPFHSGQVSFDLNGCKFETYIYPDNRKMTQEQYDLMLSDILEEASLCFEFSDIKTGIEANQRARELSLAQWSYIETSFSLLATMVWSVIEQPVRVLQAFERPLRRDRVRRVDARTLAWIEQNRGQEATGTIPETVRSSVREDSFNTYENKWLKQWLLQLRHLLKMYKNVVSEETAAKAEAYADKIGYWLQTPFFKQIVPDQCRFKISQVFRKHPAYRQCYQWFDCLYKHGNEQIGMNYSYPLRETFQLYEIWCYMQIIKMFREKGLLQDSSGLFRTTRNGLFLHFAEHNESMVKLRNGMRLSYQRVFQRNSPQFYTYTQRMVPDIVIESGEGLYILDPKYRVAKNLGTALGEMHKYRDGILLRGNYERAVKNVFILTPVQGTEIDFFKSDFHGRFGMGAFSLAPGGDVQPLKDWIEKILLHEGGEPCAR